MTAAELVAAAKAHCDPDLVPKTLPALADVADSSALTRAIGTATFTQVSDSVHLSLTFADDARLLAITVIHTSLPSTRTEEVRGLVGRHVRAGGVEGASGIRMNIKTGPNPSISLQQASYCAPMLDQASLRGVRTDVRLVDREAVAAAFRHALNYRARITLDPLGRVRAVQLEEITGMTANLPIVSGEIRMWRFLPALVDGVAVEAVVVLSGNRLVSAARWF